METDANDVGFGGVGILTALSAAVAGTLYFSNSGSKIKNVLLLSLVISNAVLVVVLYLLLSNPSSLLSYISENQLVSFVLACVVAGEVFLLDLFKIGVSVVL